MIYKILDPKKSYTFRDYFNLQFTSAEILGNLGYSFGRAGLALPIFSGDLPWLVRLKHTLRRNTRLAPLTSGAVVSPILFAVCDRLNLQLNI